MLRSVATRSTEPCASSETGCSKIAPNIQVVKHTDSKILTCFKWPVDLLLKNKKNVIGVIKHSDEALR